MTVYRLLCVGYVAGSVVSVVYPTGVDGQRYPDVQQASMDGGVQGPSHPSTTHHVPTIWPSLDHPWPP